MNAAALDVLHVPRQTDGFQTKSALSSTKQALVSCLETSVDFPSKTWHDATTRRAATLSQWDLEHQEGSSSCRSGWEWWLPFRDSNSTSKSCFPKRLVSTLWHCGQPPRWPGGSAEMEQMVGLHFSVQPWKGCKQAWLDEPEDCEGCLCKKCSQAEATWDWLQFLPLLAVFTCENSNMEIWGRTDRRWKQQMVLKGL